MERTNGTLNNLFPYLAWTAALAATVGSLFMSEIMELPPCSLCWYQRIAMYPLVIVIGAGIVLRDANMKIYSLLLCGAGFLIAAYHNLLYYGFISEALTPCTEGVPCTAKLLELFGFLSIPLMSLLSFVLIAVLLIIYRPREENHEKRT